MRADAQRLRDVVNFTWEMVPANADPVFAISLEVLVLDDEYRIITNYQFIHA